MQLIDPLAHAADILTELKKGVLLTTMVDGTVNTMTISWGTLGIQWGKPIFTVFVRGCRHTSKLLEKAGEFTVNIPHGEVDREILRFCGTASGRDVDKIRHLGLTLTKPVQVSAPGIKELPLTLECRVLYRQQQIPQCMLSSDIAGMYPAVPANLHEDYHTAYYGEIVAAYIAE